MSRPGRQRRRGNMVLGLARDAGDAWPCRPYRSLAPGPIRRVAHCCYEHAGQTFVFPNEAPGQPLHTPLRPGGARYER
jgi:hypothetical protein